MSTPEILSTADLECFRVTRAPEGGLVLTLSGGKSFPNVRLVRAAPLSHPGRYICFLDSTGQEICMINDLSELAPEERHLVEEELRSRYFITIIQKMIAVRREGGTLYWKAETERGMHELVVQESDENVRWLSERRVLMIDVDGNRFEVPDIDTLDAKSADLLREHLR